MCPLREMIEEEKVVKAEGGSSKMGREMGFINGPIKCIHFGSGTSRLDFDMRL